MSRNNRQPMAATDYAEEGLPTSDDYDPDALGTVTVEAGEPEQQWPQFGLEMVPVVADSPKYDEPSDTGRRMVMRNGKFISDVSKDYKLLPNERCVGVANEVARDIGAEPFHEFDGDWFMELDDHVFQDSDRRRVHAVYALSTDEVGGDEMEYGFAVHNSIDGSLGFSVGLFTFRHACANMVFIGTNSSAEQRALNVESEREVINRTSRAHTKGLDVDKEALKATIKGTVTLVSDVHSTYQQWVQDRVTPEEVLGLIDASQIASKDLPEWVQDIEDALDEAQEDQPDDVPLPAARRAHIAEVEMPGTESVWQTYNDVTNSIWHRGNSSDTTRRRKMKTLHRVFDPAEAGDSDATLR